MKTITDINTQLKDLYDIRKSSTSDREVNKTKKKIDYLRECMRYLESQPREEFILNEIIRLEKVLKETYSNYEVWKKTFLARGGKFEKAFSEFKKEAGIAKIKYQLDTLKYLITED